MLYVHMFIQFFQMLLVLIDLRLQRLELLHLLLTDVQVLVRLLALTECITLIQ